MNIGTMHAKILLKIDKMGGYSTANIISGEIDSFLNESISDYINQQRIALRRASGDRESIEAMENLRLLEEDQVIDSSSITQYSLNTTNISNNGFKIDISTLDNEYDYYINGRAYFNTEDYWKNCMLVNRTFINKHGVTKFNSPVFWEIPVMIDKDELIGLYSVDDGEIPNKFYINYLRKTKEIHLNGTPASNVITSGEYTDLPAHTHETIVKMATQKVVQSISGYQSRQEEGDQ